MPALPPVNKMLKVVIGGNINTAQWRNIWYLLYSSAAPTSAELNSLAAALLTEYSTTVMVNSSSDFKLTTCEITDLTSSTSAVGAASATLAGGGAVGGVASLCALAKHTIARRYRGGHPRTYVPGNSPNHLVNPQQWTTTEQSGVQTGMNAWLTYLGSYSGAPFAGLTPCNVSYYSGGSLRVTPVVDQHLTTTIEQTIGSQRRRVGR